MATTLQPPPTIKLPGSGNARRVLARDSAAPSTGIWVALAAITMTFAAFTSAMIVRQGSGNDWRHFAFPIILYWNTAVLAASSVSLQMARRRFASASADVGENSASVLRALYGTLVLGCTFVTGQYAAWHELRGTALSGLRREQFFLLRLHGAARVARNRWTNRARVCDQQVASRYFAPEHSHRRVAVLAFHGISLGVSVVIAEDKNLKVGMYLCTALEALPHVPSRISLAADLG